MKFLRRKTYGPGEAGDADGRVPLNGAPVGSPVGAGTGPVPEIGPAPDGDAPATGPAAADEPHGAGNAGLGLPPARENTGLRPVVRNGGDEAQFARPSGFDIGLRGADAQVKPDPAEGVPTGPAPAASMPSPRESTATRITMAERAEAEARPALSGEATAPVEPAQPLPPSDPTPNDAAMPAIAVPPPAAGRAGRAKTRLLGFAQPDAAADPFAGSAAPQEATESLRFPVGWLVVIDGPGRGAHFTLFNGVSQIGRGEDQTVRLDFGDNSISRSGHALLAYDDEQAKFFLGSGGKVNIVRLNDRPLLSTEELSDDDVIRIGETRLRFVAFCGPDFAWTADEADDDAS